MSTSTSYPNPKHGVEAGQWMPDGHDRRGLPQLRWHELGMPTSATMGLSSYVPAPHLPYQPTEDDYLTVPSRVPRWERYLTRVLITVAFLAVLAGAAWGLWHLFLFVWPIVRTLLFIALFAGAACVWLGLIGVIGGSGGGPVGGSSKDGDQPDWNDRQAEEGRKRYQDPHQNDK